MWVITEGSSVVSYGPGIVTTDPQFVAPVSASAAPTTTGDYRLGSGSPAIDAGNNGALPDGLYQDLTRLPRRWDDLADAATGPPAPA